MTKEFARQECIRKWQYIVDNKGSRNGLQESCPGFENYECYCPYCQLFIRDGCKNCPLLIRVSGCTYEITCIDKSHPYYNWQADKTESNAQAMLDLILST